MDWFGLAYLSVGSSQVTWRLCEGSIAGAGLDSGNEDENTTYTFNIRGKNCSTDAKKKSTSTEVFSWPQGSIKGENPNPDLDLNLDLAITSIPLGHVY